MNRIRRMRTVFAVFAFAAVLSTVSCRRSESEQDAAVPPAAVAETLTIYVPCGMELPFMAAREAFQEVRPGLRVNVVLDNANVLVRRILGKGEKPDLIVSPGLLEMEILQKEGLVGEKDVHPFGRYELVLFTSRANPAGVRTFSDLIRPEVKTIAIADPDLNSVGRYIRQALQGLGLWDQVQSKLLRTEHPITAYKHVAREKADASFAYRSCPLKTAPEKLAYSKVRILEAVPKEMYGPAFAVIAPLSFSPRREVALAFIDYLLSEKGQALLAANDVPVLPTVHAFIPCGLTSAFFGIKQAFEEQNPGTLLRLTFDRADALTERIVKEGERPDLHCSIGKVETELLVQAGLVEEAAPVPIGKFRLALCVNQSKAGLIREVADLTKPEVKRILSTPPETSSVGYYARKTLEAKGVWEQVKAKMDYLPTIKDCYKEVSANRADAVFAYIGCPVPADPSKAEYSKVKAVETIPEELYGGAVALASILKDSPHRAEAEKLITFLSGPEARVRFAKVGLETLAPATRN